MDKPIFSLIILSDFMYKVQVSKDLVQAIEEALNSKNLYENLLKKDVPRKVKPNIFEEAYKHYIGKNDLHALRLFRRSINEMLKDDEGKSFIDTTMENLENIAKVGDEYLDLFLVKLGLNNVEEALNLDNLSISRIVDYKDIDNLFMAAGHFLEAAETSLLLRSNIHFHLFYYKFLVCFNILKRIVDVKKISGADSLLQIHLEGISKVESLLAEYYRLREISELELTSEEMFYTLGNLKSLLISKYEDNDYVGVIKAYFNIMGVIEAFERSLLKEQFQL